MLSSSAFSVFSTLHFTHSRNGITTTVSMGSKTDRAHENMKNITFFILSISNSTNENEIRLNFNELAKATRLLDKSRCSLNSDRVQSLPSHYHQHYDRCGEHFSVSLTRIVEVFIQYDYENIGYCKSRMFYSNLRLRMKLRSVHYLKKHIPNVPSLLGEIYLTVKACVMYLDLSVLI